MNRSWFIWSVVLSCAVLVLGMFAWITQRALQSEHERLKAEAEALLGERVRLSLARMDSIGTDLLVLENLKPPLHYRPYFSPSDVFTNDLQDVEQGIVLQPSPIMSEVNKMIHLHFEIDSLGKVTSPQVPTGNQRERAVSSGLNESLIQTAETRLQVLGSLIPAPEELARFFRNDSEKQEEGDFEKNRVANNWISENAGNLAPAAPAVKGAYQENLDVREKSSRSIVHKDQVAKAAQQSADWGGIPAQAGSLGMNSNGILSVSPFMPMWKGEDLFFFREVKRVRSISYQGFWVARQVLEENLMAQIPVDLGEVALARLERPDPANLALVSLPWKLMIGELPEIEITGLTPLRKTLIAGWGAALLSLLALFLLLHGVMKLSERRAAFVSSVTHELRTPLTTFRLYSEMLAEGMVSDEVKKQEYLRTMYRESERLNHLVENVLSYARIERGNARSKMIKLPVSELVERIRPVLQRRVDQERATLVFEVSEDLGEIETDFTAVEQILFNLIDNSCKYGLPEGEVGEILLKISARNGGFSFEVCDQGRGIEGAERRRLFRAFHKSALEAAHDKPGVGLGLALCRRLARALGGDLKLGMKGERGACFVLNLPGDDFKKVSKLPVDL